MKCRLTILLLTLFSMVANAQENDPTSTTQAPVPPKKAVRTLSLIGGPAWIASNVYTPSGKYHWRSGFEWGGELTVLYAKGWGFGFAYMHNQTKYPDGKLTQNFVGPLVAYGRDLSKHWRTKASLGLGYGDVKEGPKTKDKFTGITDDHTQNGFCARFAIDIEYMLSQRFGIGLHIQEIRLFTEKSTFYYNGEKIEDNGTGRLGANLGLHLYL